MANIENVKKWIELLETTPEELHTIGEYEHNGKYCAWGVLAKYYEENVGSRCYSTELKDYLGIEDNHFFSKIVSLNDTHRATFQNIADYLKGYFHLELTD